MSKFSILVASAVLVGFTVAPAFAHHPFAAEYDAQKPVTLTGTITQVDWMEPHSHTFIDVRDANGKVTKWDVELGSPAAMVKGGLTERMLQVGEQVKIEGWRARDGGDRANAKSVEVKGRTLSAASSYDTKTVGTSGKK